MNRRHFTKTLSAIPLLAATNLLADAPQAAKTFTDIVRAQSGSFLDDGELKLIAKDLEDYVPLLEEVRKVKLENSDEPWSRTRNTER